MVDPDERGPSRQAREFLRLVEGSPEFGFWSAGIDDDDIQASEGLYRMLGLDTSRPIGFQLIQGMMHPDDRRAHTGILKILRSGRPVERDFRVILPDRSERWVSSRAEVLVDSDHRPVHAVGVLRDITGRHDPHHVAAAQGLDRFGALVKATAAVVWVVSPDGRALSMPQWEILTGQGPSDQQGLGWTRVLHPDDRERTAEAWRTAVRHATPYNTDYRIRCGDGIYRWYNSRGTPILNADGSVREWVGVLLKISGQSRFDLQLPPTMETPAPSTQEISPAQMRAGRGIVGLTAEELARRSNLSVSTVKRMESEASGIQSRKASLAMVRRVLEAAGVAFTFDPGRKPGVCPT